VPIYALRRLISALHRLRKRKEEGKGGTPNASLIPSSRRQYETGKDRLGWGTISMKLKSRATLELKDP